MNEYLDIGDSTKYGDIPLKTIQSYMGQNFFQDSSKVYTQLIDIQHNMVDTEDDFIQTGQFSRFEYFTSLMGFTKTNFRTSNATKNLIFNVVL